MGNNKSSQDAPKAIPEEYREYDRPFMGDECAWKPDLSLTQGDKLMFKIEEICFAFMGLGKKQITEWENREGLILKVGGSGSNLKAKAYEEGDFTPIPRFHLWSNVFDEPTRRVIEFRLRSSNTVIRLREMSEHEVDTNIKPKYEEEFSEARYLWERSRWNRTNAWFSLTGSHGKDGQEYTAGICARISMVKHVTPKPAEVSEEPARGKAAFSSKEIAEQRKNLNKSDGKEQAAMPSASRLNAMKMQKEIAEQRKNLNKSDGKEQAAMPSASRLNAMKMQKEIEALKKKLRTRDTSEPAAPSDAQRKANALKESSTKWKSNLKKTEERQVTEKGTPMADWQKQRNKILGKK